MAEIPPYSKKDLVSDLSNKFALTKTQSEEIVAFVFDQIGAKAKKTEVRITPYLTMSAVERAARTARNPQTGESVKIKKKKVFKVKLLSGFKSLLEPSKK